MLLKKSRVIVVFVVLFFGTYLLAWPKPPAKAASATKKPKVFTIPLEIETSPKSTATRAEVLAVEGNDDLLFFSFDCTGCKVEADLQLPGGMTPRIWANGAEHIFTRKTVPKTYESMFRPGKVQADDGGNLFAIATSGSTFEKNRLRGWFITSDAEAPLVFKVVRGQGYVHVSGHGVVTGPDGRTHNL
jgi:hypothetical protein